jgi:lysophospholipase L1-like esterase
VYAIQPGSSLQFTCSAGCTSFVLYTLASPSEAGEVRVDGGAARTVRASHPGLVPLSGYPINHLVWQVPAGPFGRHTLTLTATGPIDLYGIEARTGHGSLRVNNVSISGKSLRTLGAAPGYDDETNHAYGLPMVDAILHAGPTVAVIELGINDWLEGSPTSIVTTRLTKLIARVRADGARPVLYAPPQPIPLVQRHPGAGTYTQLVTAERLLAHSLKVAFLDHQKLYAPSLTDEQAIYEAGHGLGMYGDGIHPSDQGSAAMVDGYGHTPGIRAFLGL